MQNAPRRFDNRLDNKLNAKLNYGKKYSSNASAYLQDFRKVPVQRDQLDDAKRCQFRQKADHCTEILNERVNEKTVSSVASYSRHPS